MSKYDPLNRFLSQQSTDRITLTFSEIEAILGFTLPASAHRHTAWWSNSNTKAHPYSQALSNNPREFFIALSVIPVDRQLIMSS